MEKEAANLKKGEERTSREGRERRKKERKKRKKKRKKKKIEFEVYLFVVFWSFLSWKSM